jgi:hypothetical protein
MRRLEREHVTVGDIRVCKGKERVASVRKKSRE